MITPLPGETWRDVSGYEGLYAVSDLGRIRHGDALMTLTPGLYGICVRLYRSKRGTQSVMLHRLVKLTFDPIDAPKDYWVTFRNENPHDARLDNLAWTLRRGDGAPHKKLTEQAVREIRQLAEDEPELIHDAIARRYNVSRVAITHVLSGKNWAGVK